MCKSSRNNKLQKIARYGNKMERKKKSVKFITPKITHQTTLDKNLNKFWNSFTLKKLKIEWTPFLLGWGLIGVESVKSSNIARLTIKKIPKDKQIVCKGLIN